MWIVRMACVCISTLMHFFCTCTKCVKLSVIRKSFFLSACFIFELLFWGYYLSTVLVHTFIL
jgi:hypothetical protein